MIVNKPPLGLEPRFISESQYRVNRISDIKLAILRYLSNDPIKEVPVEWVQELNELISEENIRCEKLVQNQFKNDR